MHKQTIECRIPNKQFILMLKIIAKPEMDTSNISTALTSIWKDQIPTEIRHLFNSFKTAIHT